MIRNKVKEEIMYKGLFAKFTQHKNLKNVLLDTQDAILQEDSPTDYIWGTGADGTGQNLLGFILMKVRDDIRKNETSKLL